MNQYRDATGKFARKLDFEATYGDLREGVSVDLNDPEVRQTIRDISRPISPRYHNIHNKYYAVWLVGSGLAVFTSFWLGTLLYR